MDLCGGQVTKLTPAPFVLDRWISWDPRKRDYSSVSVETALAFLKSLQPQNVDEICLKHRSQTVFSGQIWQKQTIFPVVTDTTIWVGAERDYQTKQFFYFSREDVSPDGVLSYVYARAPHGGKTGFIDFGIPAVRDVFLDEEPKRQAPGGRIQIFWRLLAWLSS